MKKLLLVIIVLLSFMFVSCNGEVKKTAAGWAIEYTIEEFEKDTEYEAFGYTITPAEFIIIQNEEYQQRMFRVTIFSDDTTEKTYMVYLAFNYEGKYLRYFYTTKVFSEDNIIEVDIEVKE